MDYPPDLLQPPSSSSHDQPSSTKQDEEEENDEIMINQPSLYNFSNSPLLPLQSKLGMLYDDEFITIYHPLIYHISSHLTIYHLIYHLLVYFEMAGLGKGPFPPSIG